MKLKSLRNILIGTSAAAVAASAGIGIWALSSGPSELPTASLPLPSLGNHSSANQNSTAQSPIALEQIWDARLQPPRQAPQAPQPPQPPPTATADASFAIALVGTMQDSKQTLGLFRDSRGALDIKGVGEALQLVPPGTMVAHLEPGLARVRHGGREIPLRLTTAPANPSLSSRSMEIPHDMPTNPYEAPVDEPVDPSMVGTNSNQNNGMGTATVGVSASPTASTVNSAVPPPISMPSTPSSNGSPDPNASGDSIFDMFPHMDPTRPVPPSQPGTQP